MEKCYRDRRYQLSIDESTFGPTCIALYVLLCRNNQPTGANRCVIVEHNLVTNVVPQEGAKARYRRRMRERKEHERRRMKKSRNSERAPRKKTSERGSESYQPRKIGETNAKREPGPELDSAIEDFTWRSQHRLKNNLLAETEDRSSERYGRQLRVLQDKLEIAGLFRYSQRPDRTE